MAEKTTEETLREENERLLREVHKLQATVRQYERIYRDFEQNIRAPLAEVDQMMQQFAALKGETPAPSAAEGQGKA